MRIAKLEMITGFLLTLMAGMFLFQTLQLPPPANARDVGPAAFPLITSILIIIFSILLMIIGFKKLNSQEKVVVKRGYNIMAAIIVSSVYIWLMPKVGYYWSTAIYFPLMLLSAGERKWKRIVLVTLFFILFAKVGFETLLKVPLP